MAHVEEHYNALPSSRDSKFQSMELQRVSCFPTCFSASADDQQNEYSEWGGDIFPSVRNILTIDNINFVSLVDFVNDWVITVHGQMFVPQRPNPSRFFTGRRDELDKLREVLLHCATGSPTLRRCCLLWGLGGIGKTQICLKFIEEMSDRQVITVSFMTTWD